MATKKTQFSTARKRAVFKRRLSNEVVRYLDGTKQPGKSTRSKTTATKHSGSDAPCRQKEPARFRSTNR